MSRLHFHKWKYSEISQQWQCKLCGEIITNSELAQEYGDIEDYSETPQGYLNRLSSWRKGKAEIHDFRR
jgi:hypothetical protein